MTTPNMQPLHPTRASTYNRFGFYVGTYTPMLTAATTDPVLGDGSEQEGHWMQVGQIMYVWGRIRFGSASGTPAPSNGLGQYIVSLPTPAVDLFQSTLGANGIPIGSGMTGDGSDILNGRKVFLQLRGRGDFATGVNATALLGVYSGSFGEVNETSPFTWAAGDRLAFFATYPTNFLVDIDEGSEP